MQVLSIDIETYSTVDLPSCGVYKYAEADDFQILLFGYAIDGGNVNVIDLACGEKIPQEIMAALNDPAIIKTAFNANFERVCLSRHLRDHGVLHGGFINPGSWRCTMVWAGYMGLPMTLSGAGAVLKLDQQKMEAGKELIRYFCKPCSATAANGQRTRNYPADAPEKWCLFKAYNARDVEVELQIQQRLSRYPVPDFVWREYRQDQEINDRGILVDIPFVESAIRMDARSNAELTEKMQELTMLDNPNSVAQMKKWLADHGLETDSLGKKIVAGMLKMAPEPLRSVLLLRQQLAKSSVKKYQAMMNCACKDGRVRGMFQFYGANRSGRWAGRNVQLQNLPQNHMPDLEDARTVIRTGDYAAARNRFESVPDTLSELIRTAFIPRQGCRFIVADFSAIEARVLSWLAGETWRMETFAANKDIYCATASRMFGVPVEKGGINGHLRQKGKQAELACGYGGSVGAMVNMGALDMGMKEEELKPLVDAWRQSSPHIVQLWSAIEGAAMFAVTGKTSASTHGLTFEYRAGTLFITLPSGRRLCYAMPRIGESRFGTPSITYMGIGATKKWERLETFGGKLTENVTQAIARDLLCHAMHTLRGCRIVAHVHDEVIIEAGPDLSLEWVCEQMARVPVWAKGLILRADGYECDFYKKD